MSLESHGNLRHKSLTKGLSLIEILVCSVVLATVLGGVLTLVAAGRRSTEYETAYLTALNIAEFVAQDLRKEAACGITQLPNEPTPMPLAGAGKRSSYGQRLLTELPTLEKKFPKLSEKLSNFQIAVDLEAIDGVENSLMAQVTVLFRLHSGDSNWHQTSLSTIVSTKAPF